MERSVTIDLPVEQVAKVVKRHLVYHQTSSASSSSLIPPRPSRKQRKQQQKQQQQQKNYKLKEQQQQQQKQPTYNTHHLLPGGSILDEIYKWTAHVENKQQKRNRAQSISLPAIREPIIDASFQSLKQPGGFRRHYVLNKAARQGKRLPNFVTSSFVEFLCLYGHFGGENLSDADESSSDSESSYHSSEDEASSEEDVHEVEGSIMAYRGQPLKNYVSYGSTDDQEYSSLLPTTTSKKPLIPLQYEQLEIRERMPLLSRSRPGQTLQGKATPGKAMFLLLKSFVTTGIMFLPKAFYNGGLVFSIFAIVAWAFISLWSFLLLVQTRLIVPASFSDMGGVLYGSKMRKAVLVSITLSQIGFVCAYMIFVAENLQALVLTFSKCRVLIPMHLLILAQSFAFIPLAMIRKIQRLSIFALIADVFIVIGLSYLFYYDIKELIVIGIAKVEMWNPVHFPLFIGTAAFTFEGIGLVIPITESMKEPKKFPSVLTKTLVIITCLFISMGALSYMTFGDNMQTIILLNLPSKDPMVSTIQTLYSFAICLSIPLQLFPAIRIMENGLFTTKSGKNNAIVKWQKNVFRVFIVFLCAGIGIMGSKDKLDKFVSLIGALFCIPLCFIFPPLFHLKALKLPTIRRLANYSLILFGGICMIFVFFTTLTQWNSSEPTDPVKQCIIHKV
ncbi:transmembrane amino acid transporter protein-domain-containing protein [Cokeromyces recurvatus]|uniref:transmembrane amino acid transporter protein-domain-containing protein n=1 Tax=Cokeromyces recurvatus TaxID=90255 RepID=UPI00221E58A9|nr:transmembrane amino acid transporter protein-domain-containing protein [Cokeromyces recurvatus]KAI7906870.1 transmembrane amino acid transporter protein-domain-containing protein [Cokeromyces recurvatus]